MQAWVEPSNNFNWFFFSQILALNKEFSAFRSFCRTQKFLNFDNVYQLHFYQEFFGITMTLKTPKYYEHKH